MGQNALLDFLQGASNSAASTVSAPVDALAWALRKAGLPVNNPVGGSDWMAQQGLTREPQNRAAGLLGESVAGVAPMLAAAKAPQLARGLLAAQDAAKPVIAGAAENYMLKTGMAQPIFIGKGAKTWDAAAAAKAQQMEQQGVPARQIWSETGNWKGPDGFWRQEIPDNAAKARDYNFTPQKAYDNARLTAMIEDSQPLRDYANAMAPYSGMTKTQLQNEYARTGGEIVDAALSGNKDLALKLSNDRSGLTNLLSEMGNRQYGPVSSFLKHGELGKAYPEVYNLHTRIDPSELADGAKAHYFQGSPFQGEQIVLGNKPVFSGDKSSLIHELQHSIQQREGWARGGSPEGIARDPLSYVSPTDIDYAKTLPAYNASPDKDGFIRSFAQMRLGNPSEAYWKLAGEAEARATQSRLNMDAAQRRATFPEDSYDVPINQLIIRGLLK